MILERGVFTQKIMPVRVALTYAHGVEHDLRSRQPLQTDGELSATTRNVHSNHVQGCLIQCKRR